MIDVIKYMISESISTYRNEGFAAILSKGKNLCERNINWLKFNKDKYIHKNTTYQIDGIQLDLDFDQFNKQTKSNLMSGDHFSHVTEIRNIIRNN